VRSPRPMNMPTSRTRIGHMIRRTLPSVMRLKLLA
jgi:hypothetical protein